MSLEQALAENTAALKVLAATIAAAHPLTAPSAQPAPPAPFTAAVVPPQTAPVASTDSSPAPTAVFGQHVQIAPAPVTTAAPLTAPPAAGVERDSKGMPYDGRIHSSTKAKVADGSWRYKRGTDDAYIKQIEDELRGAAAAPVPAGGVGTPWPFPDPVAAPVVTPVVVPPPVAAPPVATPLAVPVAPSAGITTYEALMAALPPKIVSGELTAGQMQEACESYGVPSIAALSGRPDLVPFIAAALRL